MTVSVVVVGGGYAGIAVAQGLDSDARVTLIDPKDAFVNYSASLRAVSRAEWAERPFFDYRTLLSHGRVVRDVVTSVDHAGVRLGDGTRIEADHIVLATGSSHAYPAHPRAESTSTDAAVADLHATRTELGAADRVLILGAGAVGLELAGELREAWPDKQVTVLDPATELLPGFLPEVRAALRRQLADLGVDLRLGTSLTSLPSVPPATHEPFTVETSAGTSISADLWLRCFGSRPNTGYLDDGALVALSAQRLVPVDVHLNVTGHRNVWALGDIADLPDPKMASYAQTQAPVVVDNIRAALQGAPPGSTYAHDAVRRILLPLGTEVGVGQLPDQAGGAFAASVEQVRERKGIDLFTARFSARFAPTPEGDQ